MPQKDDDDVEFSQEDHQVAYIFDPDEDEHPRGPAERPTKRRKVSKQTRKKASSAQEADEEPLFVPLLGGAEKAECVRVRQRLFEESWAQIDGRIQGILRDSNSSTLDQVSDFVAAARTECLDQIPAAFIMTGPNIASQDLLFEQLSETLQRSFASRFVRLRSSEAVTLKAALKKTIRDATASGADDDVDEELQLHAGQSGRRYLDYDLEALEAYVKPHNVEHVFVAFQDSEGFDSGLISDLTSLFHSWRRQIPFTLLFGIATSVELLQARLLKSACRLMYGAQFDCVQTGTILETVFKGAVASGDAPLQLGAPLLRSMLDRQQEQIAGIQAFISSLKYAYMCHFYANPLSILASSDALTDGTLQPEHVEALRHLDSFRCHVEGAVEPGGSAQLAHARALIEDDEYLFEKVGENAQNRQRWVENVLRSILVLEAAGEHKRAFSDAYVRAIGEGAGLMEESGFTERIRRMSADDLAVFLARVIQVFTEGDDSLRLPPVTADGELELAERLQAQQTELEMLREAAEQGGFSLRSKYSGQSKVMRTTVIAQRVQLSRDSAALRDEDKRLTDMVDELVGLLTTHFGEREPGTALFSECWLYESRWPSREVLVPRPRAVFERALSRPHDYLACSCCQPGTEGIQATLPATSVLYHLYQETGSLINVADLWAAFEGLAGQEGSTAPEDRDEEHDDDSEGREAARQRETLTQFYRGLAELRAMGFVKASKKKVDHVAKAKWL